MKYIFVIIGSVAVAVSLVALGFNFKQVNEQEATLTTNLEQRTLLVADGLKDAVETYYATSTPVSYRTALQRTADKVADRERLAGIFLYDNSGALIATSSKSIGSVADNDKAVSAAMDSDTRQTNFFTSGGELRYAVVDPLHNGDSITGALMIVQNAGYIATSVQDIWRSNLLRLGIQLFLFSITIFIILRFFVFRQVVRLVDSVKRVRMGESGAEIDDAHTYSFFMPLAKEIIHITKSLAQARLSAREEARMRLEKLDSPWTAGRLAEFTKAHLKDRPIFVVSNREPYEHYDAKGKIAYKVPASGMVTAIEPILEACGGTWIAWGSGNADKQVVDQDDKIRVPLSEPKYTLKRVWLTDKEVNGFYKGFSNEALWPLCHIAHTRPIFNKGDWADYQRVNKKFAESVLAEIKLEQHPIILVQDFHLALVPQLIKKSRPDAQIGIFWHIPWPNVEAFSICPWRKEILEGMLGADIIGFHTQQFCNNFIETVNKSMESLADLEHFSIVYKRHTSYIKPFPISIDFTSDEPHDLDLKKGKEYLKALGISSEYIGLGVDRMDYTKGILERFKGIELFMDNFPQYRKNFTFLQIAAPSRESVQKYREFAEAVTHEAERINEKFKSGNWRPIVLLKEHHSHEQLASLYRVADVCLVTSLHDGMNLVSKEYVSARSDETGVLVLSQFTGAARDMKGALIVNPYSAIETSEALNAALNMPPLEQHRRMKKMRESVKNYNVYRWSAEFIRAVINLV